MRFRTWVNVTLFLMAIVFCFFVFADGLMISWIGLFGFALCSLLLNKYSGFWN